jgi:ATP synthase subunit 6
MLKVMTSPLEQFLVLPLPFPFFSLTNQTITLFLVLIFFIVFYNSLLTSNGTSLLMVPTRAQLVFEHVFILILNLVAENISHKRAPLFFPFILFLFLFNLSLNLIGLIPYSFAVTSQCVTALFLSTSIFLGVNLIGIRKHGIKMFSLFLPSGTSVLLAFILVPVEFLSYVSKPFSMATRLFCNVMAGHILVKVLVGFSWSLMGCSGLIACLYVLPLIALVLILILELGISIIQSFIFSLLVCIYINDVLNLH